MSVIFMQVARAHRDADARDAGRALVASSRSLEWLAA
jgi:hypothetical protein